MNTNQNQTSKRFLVITGNGKGKTTAALGLALRAWGHDMKIGMIHFVKSRIVTGEVKAIQKINKYANHCDEIGLDQYVMGLGFLPKGGKQNPLFARHQEMAVKAIHQAKRMLQTREYSVLILDEICWAIHKELISESQALELRREQPEGSVLVFTGRGATSAIKEAADTVSEIQDSKHAYADMGLPAQIGVEK